MESYVSSSFFFCEIKPRYILLFTKKERVHSVHFLDSNYHI